ncbi:MAG: hypothetical protein JXQ90_16075 [Cyclobacteriaceae bacterium]
MTSGIASAQHLPQITAVNVDNYPRIVINVIDENYEYVNKEINNWLIINHMGRSVSYAEFNLKYRENVNSTWASHLNVEYLEIAFELSQLDTLIDMDVVVTIKDGQDQRSNALKLDIAESILKRSYIETVERKSNLFNENEDYEKSLKYILRKYAEVGHADILDIYAETLKSYVRYLTSNTPEQSMQRFYETYTTSKHIIEDHDDRLFDELINVIKGTKRTELYEIDVNWSRLVELSKTEEVNKIFRTLLKYELYDDIYQKGTELGENINNDLFIKASYALSLFHVGNNEKGSEYFKWVLNHWKSGMELSLSDYLRLLHQMYVKTSQFQHAFTISERIYKETNSQADLSNVVLDVRARLSHLLVDALIGMNQLEHYEVFLTSERLPYFISEIKIEKDSLIFNYKNKNSENFLVFEELVLNKTTQDNSVKVKITISSELKEKGSQLITNVARDVYNIDYWLDFLQNEEKESLKSIFVVLSKMFEAEYFRSLTTDPMEQLVNENDYLEYYVFHSITNEDYKEIDLDDLRYSSKDWEKSRVTRGFYFQTTKHKENEVYDMAYPIYTLNDEHEYLGAIRMGFNVWFN